MTKSRNTRISVTERSVEIFGAWWVFLAADLPRASERDVSAEIQAMLREQFFATRLDEYAPGTELVTGTLVYQMTEHRRRPEGIHRGVADLLLARVGRWRWEQIELKERGRNGLCAGRLEPEQLTAYKSGLYPVAWCAAHVRQIIHDLDQKHPEK